MRATDEQIVRVILMSQGDPAWDLSPKDTKALAAVLAELAPLRKLAEAVEGFYVCHNTEDGFRDSKEKMFDALWQSQRKEPA